MVLVPGVGAPGASWADLVPGLAAAREVVLVDTLGGPGGSRQEVPLRRFDDHVRWLDAMLRGLDVDAFRLVGSSMGGRIALGLGIVGHPGLRSLALLEPVQAFTRLPARAMVDSLGALPGAPDWLWRRFLRAGGVATPETSMFAQALRRFSVSTPFPPLPTDGELAAVSVPTMVLLGGRSALLDAERARRRAAARLPHVRVEVWPEAGHAVGSADSSAMVERLLAHADHAEARSARRTEAVRLDS